MTTNKTIDTPEEIEMFINGILDAQKEYDTNVAPLILKYENIRNKGVAIYTKERNRAAGQCVWQAEHVVKLNTSEELKVCWLEIEKIWDKYLAAKEEGGWKDRNFYWENSRKIERPFEY